ncbi:MAG: MurR/RpiR family transcriptional regulator [Pseudomonadota bacterium]
MQSELPGSAEAVLERLTGDFDALSPQLQRAARFIIDQPREVGVHSMRTLATKAEVHPNTLVRLAQAIGFDGYEALRERFRDFVVGEGLGGFRDRAEWLQALVARGGSGALMAEMAEATAGNLDAMWQRQEAAKLDAVADAILGAPKVYVLGMGSAYSLAHQFWYVARMAFEHVAPIPRHGSQPIDDLAWITAEDVLVALTFQPYRAETLQAVRRAREIGATVVGVTDSRTSPLAALSDHVLAAPTHTPQFFESHAAVTALLEGLVAVLVARAGPVATARVETFHRQRLEAGLYEEPAALAQRR